MLRRSPRADRSAGKYRRATVVSVTIMRSLPGICDSISAGLPSNPAPIVMRYGERPTSTLRVCTSRIIRSLRSPRPKKLPMNLLGHGLDAAPVGRHRDVGDFGVELRTVAHQLGELLLRIGVIEQRPVAPMARPLELLADRGFEIDHGAALREHAAILHRDHGAPAGGDDYPRKAREALDGLPFALPEARLALLLEYEGDIDPRPRLDVGIAIVKAEAQEPRQMAPHGGL